MLNSSKVTVIMGIYNCSKTLNASLESLFSQTYKNWNVIMCDDGSTDDTYCVAEGIARQNPNKVILIKNDKNMGLNFTLNKCLDLADGTYIARMDGDDICDSTRFEKEVAFLDNNPQFAFVSTHMVMFDESGDWGIDQTPEEPTPKDIVRGRTFCHAGCMIRKEAFVDVDGYSVAKKLLRVEDLHLWVKLYAKGYKGYNIQEPLYKMRDDRNAYSRRKFSHRFNEYYVRTLAIKLLKLPIWYRIYAIKPILVGLCPRFIYNLLHKRALRAKGIDK